jgi:hypothetical protein
VQTTPLGTRPADWVRAAADEAAHLVWAGRWASRRPYREPGADPDDLPPDDDDDVLEAMTWHPYDTPPPKGRGLPRVGDIEDEVTGLPPRPSEPVVSWTEDVPREPATDRYRLAPPWDHLTCSQVNAVYTSLLQGSAAIVPWLPEKTCVRTMSTTALSQRLLGVLCPISANRNRVFWLKLMEPFSTTLQVCPQDMSLHETASSNNALGELAAYTATALVSQRCDLGPQLRIGRRRCHNRVYITYLPGGGGAEAAAPHHQQPCRDPTLGKRVVLVGFSRNPRILVGTASAAEMRRAMGVFLPRLLAPPPPAPPPKRPRDEDEEEEPATQGKRGRYQ